MLFALVDVDDNVDGIVVVFGVNCTKKNVIVHRIKNVKVNNNIQQFQLANNFIKSLPNMQVVQSGLLLFKLPSLYPITS